MKLVEVEEVKEWEVENIKIREVVEYLVQWKGFTVEHNSWKREKDLKCKRSSNRVWEKIKCRD